MITERNTLPKCVVNDCGEGHVKFNDECTEFNSQLACLKVVKNENYFGKKFKLDIDPATHKLACTDDAHGVFCDKHECKIVSSKKIKKIELQSDNHEKE